MKLVRCIIFSFLMVTICASYTSSLHKYYISNTQIEYVKAEKSIQIISRVFIDDLEKVLTERYEKAITINDVSGNENDAYLKDYLNTKLQFKINNKERTLNFVGKEISGNLIKCYLEINKVKHLKSIEVSNQILLDLFAEQQNITKLNINNTTKSYLLSKQNSKAKLGFN